MSPAETWLLLLILTMFASIFLGMGLPTVAAYVLLAIIVAPALEDCGVPLMAAHLFVLYFGILSVLTPPVCLASYTASTIAGSNPMYTGYLGFRLSLVGFLLPFVFVYNPSFLAHQSVAADDFAPCSRSSWPRWLWPRPCKDILRTSLVW